MLQDVEQSLIGEKMSHRNSSFIFTVCVKLVPLYHSKLAYVILHIAVKEFFETSKNGDTGRFKRALLKESF